jgi:signal transduction histidine kinase
VAGGKNDVRIEFASADEVGELAEAFQIMLKKINQSIEDNKAITTEMEVARDLAVGANQAKSEFLSRMSHELRTPLNAILGFGQLLEIDEEFPLTRKQKDGVEEIIKAGNHLLELINEILDLSKIESGSLGISLEMINLNEVIEEVVSMVDPLKEKYSISIKNNINSNPVINVFADRTRLKQVLLNLMSNTIKYNHKDGVVTLESKISGSDRLQITVADTGKGIPPEYLEAAFEPFNRLDAENTEIEGSGIGLTITKRIMDLMNGTITVESTLGKGSRFTIELPSEQISKEAEV